MILPHLRLTWVEGDQAGIAQVTACTHVWPTAVKKATHPEPLRGRQGAPALDVFAAEESATLPLAFPADARARECLRCGACRSRRGRVQITLRSRNAVV